jgi:hypothetical protein
MLHFKILGVINAFRELSNLCMVLMQNPCKFAGQTHIYFMI